MYYPGFIKLFVGQFITLIAFQTPMVLWSFFTKHQFSWDERDIGYSIAVFGLLYTFVQFVVVRFTAPILKTRKSIYLGFTFFIIGFIGIGLAPNITVFYVSLVIYTFGSIASSSAVNLFTINVSEQEQGQLQGLLSSVNSLSAIIGPLIVTSLFYYGIKSQLIFGAGLPFIFSAALLVFGCLLYYLGMKKLANVD